MLFPGFLVTLGGLAGLGLAWRRRAPHPARELAGFYALLAALAVWLSFGPEAGFEWHAPYLVASTRH